MNQNQAIYILDAGNTQLKLGVFRDGNLVEVERFEYNNVLKLKEKITRESALKCCISSVVSEEVTNELIEILPFPYVLNRHSQLPITLNYETPETLGFDRMCNAVASYFLSNQKQAVSIDIGTCIKFDFIDENGNYQGGSISPGIDLRYKSMNDYTANLPLITDRISTDLIGMNTFNSMRSGVLNGIQAELNQFITLYSEQYQDLTFFVTGGDAVYFDFQSKNNTFVDENLTLKGLYQIYVFNAN